MKLQVCGYDVHSVKYVYFLDSESHSMAILFSALIRVYYSKVNDKTKVQQKQPLFNLGERLLI